MANIVSETQWHGNPRPITSYVTTVFEDSVVSPYYNDRRSVPDHNTYNTSVPLEALVPTPTIDILGPAAAVVFTLQGLWTSPTVLNIAITLTGNTLGDVSTAVAFSTDVLGPVGAAEAVAGVINALGLECVATTVDNVVTVTAVAPVTACTITTLTVA